MTEPDNYDDRDPDDGDGGWLPEVLCEECGGTGLAVEGWDCEACDGEGGFPP